MAWADSFIDTPDAPYPRAPWVANSQYWAALFRADRPTNLPHDLRPLLGKHARVVTVVRYLPGSTLVYDELIVAVPVLLGWRPALYIDHIWVDSLASLWGGRRIWGLPKRVAEFTWEAGGVTVTDSGRPLMRLALDRSPARGPMLPFVTASLGRLEQGWTWSAFPMRARFGRAGMRILALSDRFGFHLSRKPYLALASRDCVARFPPPALIH